VHLKELQRWMTDAVRSSRPAPESVAGELFTGGHAQIEIYREQFWLRHVPNLEDDFPTVLHLVGKDRFKELCVGYLEAFPPRTFDLRRLGESFAAHVPRELREAASYDWAFMHAYDVPAVPPFDPSFLATVPEDAWPEAKIGFHPSLTRIRLSRSYDEVRRALRKKEQPPDLRDEEVFAVVYRGADLTLYSVRVEASAFALLEALGAGEPLGPACVKAGAGEAELGRWFQDWTAYGWIAAVQINAERPSPRSPA
jgi:hypothetical protein